MSSRKDASVLAVPSGFRFASGRLCLDLTATLTDRGDQAVELLARPSDLAAWLHRVGLLDPPPSVDTAQLQEARRLREAIARSALATARGERLPREEVDRINRGARYPVVPLLDPDTGTVTFDAPRRVEGAFGRIARDAVDLLGGEERVRIRVCARPGCGRLFVDRTRTGSRRWCSMATCGNQGGHLPGEGRYPFRVQVSPLSPPPGPSRGDRVPGDRRTGRWPGEGAPH